MKEAAKSYLLARLSEPSTWRGIAMIATMAGAPAGAIDPIVQVGLFLVGLIGAVIGDKK